MRDQDNLRALQLSQDVPELGKLLLAESVCGLIENQEVCPQQCGNSTTNREHHKREGHMLALTSRTCDSSAGPLRFRVLQQNSRTVYETTTRFGIRSEGTPE